ncbi:METHYLTRANSFERASES SUPERFAMILY PROTEIN putative-RELATED [Salix purpurea]|uniref:METHYLTRANSFERASES SUPERFAMILY PROTEIN putative-RELATED n=1 Tax=Salix purpurea TaxID=77065 RepID=A0A9Q0UA85_SALPP|nr:METHYLTRANSFERASES SUPERFAMILY PROTEIN putative-RELATED [Salix purpurea]
MSDSATDAPPMVGGDGICSYYKNSYLQRRSANVVKEKIDEEIAKKLDFHNLPGASNTFRLADLGCSVGPNTFFHVQDLLEAIKQKYEMQFRTSQTPEFQVFFNDQPMNDFNTLFNNLQQERQYFAAGVPGSFYDRLFPESFLHFVHCSTSLHWLSKLPEQLLDKNSPAWNRGRIHYTNAPNEVVSAYASQFARDMENFLSVRSKELVSGGMVVIISQGIPNGMLYSELQNGVMFECMSLSLMDMVEEGTVSEAQVDSFNLPFYAASPEEMTEIVERNGFFSIERMELNDPAAWLKRRINIPEWVVHVRAAMEKSFSKHFGREVPDELFDRLTKKLGKLSDELELKYREKTLLLVVLKRQ